MERYRFVKVSGPGGPGGRRRQLAERWAKSRRAAAEPELEPVD